MVQRQPASFLVKAAAAIAVLAGLAACSSDFKLPAPGSGGPDLAGGSTPDAPAFNPFSDSTETSVGRRQVIQNPSREEVLKTGPLPEFSIGRADAPVVMIKYMSLTCPYCRRFQAETFPVLKREYIDTGKVRFIFREFPIGKTSGAATIALRCAPMDKYLTLYEKFLFRQAQWVSQEVRLDPIYKIASEVGISREQFDSCRKNQAMIDGLKWVKERGRELGVIGTPNFFIDGRLVKNVIGMKEIREIVDPLVAARVAGGGPSL
ncbi:MAG: DsbA family protein [Bacteroidota bacterium]|jgi:protein-disulfide isomerase